MRKQLTVLSLTLLFNMEKRKNDDIDKWYCMGSFMTPHSWKHGIPSTKANLYQPLLCVVSFLNCTIHIALCPPADFLSIFSVCYLYGFGWRLRHSMRLNLHCSYSYFTCSSVITIRNCILSRQPDMKILHTTQPGAHWKYPHSPVTCLENTAYAAVKKKNLCKKQLQVTLLCKERLLM